MFPFADNNPTHRTPFVTYALIAINVIAFLWFGSLSDERQLVATLRYGFIPARIEQLRTDEPIVVRLGEDKQQRIGLTAIDAAPPAVQLAPNDGEIYRSLLTCMFLHGGWMHLIGNMWFLFIFGNNIEDRLGHVVFLLFYLLGGLAATGAHWAMYSDSTTPVIGASGAVSAVLGAYAVTYPFARVHTLIFLVIFVTVVDLPALAVLGFWFLGQLLSFAGEMQMKINGGVAFLAHIGGFVAGAVAMPILNAIVPHPKPPRVAEREPYERDDRWSADRWW
jgi:membrane associated rhomboid family serine protease